MSETSKQFDMKMVNSKTGKVLMEGRSIDAYRESLPKSKSEPWTYLGLVDNRYEFIRGRDIISFNLDESVPGKFVIGDKYDIKVR